MRFLKRSGNLQRVGTVAVEMLSEQSYLSRMVVNIANVGRTLYVQQRKGDAGRVLISERGLTATNNTRSVTDPGESGRKGQT
jgi:hypothetical protein